MAERSPPINLQDKWVPRYLASLMRTIQTKKEIKIEAITLFAYHSLRFGQFLPRILYSLRRYLLMDGLWPRNALTSTDCRGFAENFSAWFSQHVCRSTWTLHPLCDGLYKLHYMFYFQINFFCHNCRNDVIFIYALSPTPSGSCSC